MQKLSLASFIVGVFLFVAMNAFAQTSSPSNSEGSLKIKELVKSLDLKISKDEILKMIDTLAQSGQVSKSDAEKAKKEISAMSDTQFSKSTQSAIDKIPEDMTVDEASDTKKMMEKLKKTP